MNTMIEAFNTPWKVTNRIRQIIVTPLVWLQFRYAGIRWGRSWQIYGLIILQVHRKSTVTIGDHLQLRNFKQSNPLTPTTPVTISARDEGTVIQIGDYYSMTGGGIIAAHHIRIGNNVAVGANTIICDTDFHPLRPSDRMLDPNEGATAPIVIEDNVFIGMQSLILKGVTVGTGSVIGAGSVVTRDVPPGVIAAGNPARVIREL